MSKDDSDVMGGIAILVGVALFGLLCWWFFPKFGHWWTNSLFPVKARYCQSIKKIVEAEPIYEDNGKYEDEAYKVKYDDGSVGITDNATMRSGTYCVSPDWIKVSEGEAKGLDRQP